MAIFAIISQPNPSEKAGRLDAAIKTDFPGAFKLDGNVGWLISAQTSAQNLAEQLKISNTNENGAAIVFEIKSYWGRANPNTWTWLKEKLEAASNG